MAFKMRGFSGFKQADWTKKSQSGNPMDFVRGQKIKAGKKLKGEANDVLDFGNPRKQGKVADEQIESRLENIEQKHDVFAGNAPQDVKAAHRALNRSYKDASADKLYKTKRNTRIPLKQYADKNVSVDKVSDDGMTFTGTDSKGKTGQYKTSGYDAEIMQSDSVGVSGDAVSSMQMEFDMVKGTKYEKDFIDYHGKGNKPGTGKSPAKQRAKAQKPPIIKPYRETISKLNEPRTLPIPKTETIRTSADLSNLPHNKKKKASPAKQTSHGPIREYQIPNNPNEGPYIVRSRSTGQTVEPNNDGPDYRHIRERTGLDDGPHPERPKQLRNYDAFKAAGAAAAKAAKHGSPAKKYVSDAQRKAVHASKAERGESPAKQVARMKEATRAIPRTGMLREVPIEIPRMEEIAKPIEAIPVQRLGKMVSQQKKTAKQDNKIRKGRI